MLRHLTVAYQNQVNLMLYILGSNQQNLKLCICVGFVSMGKSQQAFKITPVNLESGTPRTSLKRISAGVERRNCPKPRHLYLQLQKISAKTAIFTATKHGKTTLAVI